MGIMTKRERVWILCVVLFCAVLLLVSAATAGNTATMTITGVVKRVSPQPDFTYTPTSPKAGESVTFVGTSTGLPISWSWNFGDGGTSLLQNPSHTYTGAGTYTVTLTVTDAAGLSGTVSKPITVTAPLKADFTATQTTCTCSWKVKFTDTSTGTPTSWKWEYQKKGTTTWTTFASGTGAQNPSFSFSTSTTYNIRLTVYRGTESNSVEKSIIPGKLAASFSASSTSGKTPLTVMFTDTSTGIPTSWKWEYQMKGTTTWTTFASGTGAQNPSFSFTTSGKYSIKLTVTNGVCPSSTVTKTDYITVMGPCDPVVASFTGSPTSGNKPLTVQFTDKSTGPIVSWQWDFQNDNVYDSNLQNPSFIYTTKQKYSVKLTVTNACGTSKSTMVRSSYINVK
jgi:PKD repeat protein